MAICIETPSYLTENMGHPPPEQQNQSSDYVEINKGYLSDENTQFMTLAKICDTTTSIITYISELSLEACNVQLLTSI